MIWSERYDRDIENIFDVQDEITQSMVTGLAPEIGAHERRISRRKPTESLSAWEMCQHGLGQLDRSTSDGIISAYGLFQAAATPDPTYALPPCMFA